MESNQGSDAFEGDQGSGDQNNPPPSPLFFAQPLNFIDILGGDDEQPNFDNDDSMAIDQSFSESLEEETYDDPLASDFPDDDDELFGTRPDDPWEDFLRPTQSDPQNTSFNSVGQSEILTTENHDIGSSHFWEEDSTQPGPSNRPNTTHNGRVDQIGTSSRQNTSFGETTSDYGFSQPSPPHRRPTPFLKISNSGHAEVISSGNPAVVGTMDATNQAGTGPTMSEKRRGKQPVYDPPVPAVAPAQPFASRPPPALPPATPAWARGGRPAFPDVAAILEGLKRAPDAARAPGPRHRRILLEDARRYGRDLVSLTREVGSVKTRVLEAIGRVKARLSAMWRFFEDLKRRGLRGGHARKLRASGKQYKSFRDMTPSENTRRREVEARDLAGRRKIDGLRDLLDLVLECEEALKVQVGLCNEVFRRAGVISCTGVAPEGTVAAQEALRGALARSLEGLKKVQQIGPMLETFLVEFRG
ncbi:hypothetical protein H2204_001709 [Knufia peltigerae]|uniref:Uncharacterized protein n=1 Tax=Knufia peltigerae TaxID=1002370 RepID=A0AA39D227_9EURO|nr:hypothetical protein H2204_001709 [Knufia peltigerae]